MFTVVLYCKLCHRSHSLKNYYDTLGVSETATSDDIRKAYRKLASKHHPDKNGGAKEAEEKFKEIAEAYETLSNETKRKNYDMSRGGSRNSFFENFQDFSFGGRRSNFDNLTITIDKWATLSDLMKGTEFEVQYTINRNTSASNGSEIKNVRVAVNLSTTGYPITVNNGKYSIILKVRGAGSVQEVQDQDFFGRSRRALMTGDLIVRVNIDMMGIDIEQSDLVQRVEVDLYSILFNEEVVFESPLGKKYKIKSFNRDTLSDIVVKIPEQGLVSAYGKKGNYLFKVIVKKPDFSKISEENLQILKDSLLDLNK